MWCLSLVVMRCQPLRRALCIRSIFLTYKRVVANSTVVTYNWMLKAAKLQLVQAQATEEARMFSTMSTLLYSAFALEAYFNHLGAIKVEDWLRRERRLSKRKKLEFLLETIGLDLDSSSEPVSAVVFVFKFRDMLAHGRTESLVSGEIIVSSDYKASQVLPDAEWQQYCTLSKAESVYRNTKMLIEQMHEAAGLGKYPFLRYQGGSISETNA
ncbi:hypothetical protein FLM07_18555 [Vibrio cholerae]|nr:hypothetical protein FLM07_18555 [Vibrio cholerae]